MWLPIEAKTIGFSMQTLGEDRGRSVPFPASGEDRQKKKIYPQHDKRDEHGKWYLKRFSMPYWPSAKIQGALSFLDWPKKYG